MPDQLALRAISMLHCIDEREGGLSLRQVVPEVFPELALIGFIVERVIDQLEGGADMPAKTRQGAFYYGGRVAETRSDLGSRRGSPGRIALDAVTTGRLRRV